MIGTKEKVGNDIYGVKSDWKLKERLGDGAETGFRHSDHYHKYFHGYSEVRIEKPNGKYAIERIYTEDWYVPDMTDSGLVIRKLLMVIMTIISAIIYILAMSRPNLYGNKATFVAIPGFAVIILLLLLAASTIGFLFTKKKMTWWEQHASTFRIETFSLLTAIMQCLAAILVIVNIFTGVESVSAELVLAFEVLLSAVPTFGVYILFKRITLKREKNDNELPEGEVHIIL